jgi:hypothetical protein
MLSDSQHATSHFLIGQFPASSRPRRACAKSNPNYALEARFREPLPFVYPDAGRARHSRPSSLSKAQRNDGEGILALSGHGFNRAVLPSPLASLPLARLSSSRRPWRACAKSSPRPRLFSPAFVRRCQQLAPFAWLFSSRRPRRACAKSNPSYALEARFREPLPFVYPDAGRARHSRPSSLSKAQLGLPLDARQGILALSGHGFNRAVLPNPLASLPLARLFSSRRPWPASAKSSPCPSLGPSQELLDAYLNGRKQSTSHFLIDIFGACLTRRPPWRVNRPLSPGPFRASQRAAFTPPALSAVEGRPSRRVVPTPKLACAKADCSPLASALPDR